MKWSGTPDEANFQHDDDAEMLDEGQPMLPSRLAARSPGQTHEEGEKGNDKTHHHIFSSTSTSSFFAFLLSFPSYFRSSFSFPFSWAEGPWALFFKALTPLDLDEFRESAWWSKILAILAVRGRNRS
jgi:hypothetical protein